MFLKRAWIRALTRSFLSDMVVVGMLYSSSYSRILEMLMCSISFRPTSVGMSNLLARSLWHGHAPRSRTKQLVTSQRLSRE